MRISEAPNHSVFTDYFGETSNFVLAADPLVCSVGETPHDRAAKALLRSCASRATRFPRAARIVSESCPAPRGL